MSWLTISLNLSFSLNLNPCLRFLHELIRETVAQRSHGSGSSESRTLNLVVD